MSRNSPWRGPHSSRGGLEPRVCCCGGSTVANHRLNPVPLVVTVDARCWRRVCVTSCSRGWIECRQHRSVHARSSLVVMNGRRTTSLLFPRHALVIATFLALRRRGTLVGLLIKG